MLRLFLYMVAFILFSTSSAEARAVKHSRKAACHAKSDFQGTGVFFWHEICYSGNNYAPFVVRAKSRGVKFVIVKAFDGGEWGVLNRRGVFQTQLNEDMIKAFHAAGIKCYGYGTAWLKPRSEVGKAAQHAINILHKTSAGGVVFDDVFAYGYERQKTEVLFATVRRHMKNCKSCGKKTLAFSTFPSVWRQELPWDIPMKYCDYYLPQIYWADMGITPAAAVRSFQADWNAYRRKHKGVSCKVVPVASTIGRGNVTLGQIREFILTCKKFGYSNMAFFRWDGTSAGEWAVIQKNKNK